MKNDVSEYISLDMEIRPRIPTRPAAFYLCKKPQTLRSWACFEDGPIKPIRIHGRLFWSTDEIRNLLKGPFYEKDPE